MNKASSNILSLIEQIPDFHHYYDQLFKRSSQVIVFGSYAAGYQNEKSDVDILFVTEGKGFKNESFDFICIHPKRIYLKSWLGSELANHVAKYGIWLKGDDHWRNEVFISESAINRKKILILSRFAQLWVKHKSIQHKSMIRLFESIVLDTGRLSAMMDGIAVPPTTSIKDQIKRSNKNLLKELCKEKYLGKVAEVYVNELLRKNDISEINSLIIRKF